MQIRTNPGEDPQGVERVDREFIALLFPSAADENHHMAPATLYKVYYPTREAAGRKDLRWHDLATRVPYSPPRPAPRSPS